MGCFILKRILQAAVVLLVMWVVFALHLLLGL